MKSELALLPVDVEAITPRLVAQTLETVARGKAVFAQLFRENRDLIKEKGRKIVLPISAPAITILEDVAPGATIPPSTIAYTGLTIEVAKFGINFPLTKEALEMPRRDLIEDAFLEAGSKWAIILDNRAVRIAFDIKSGTITSWTGGTLGSTTLTPILEITSVSGATIKSVDYYEGKILLTSSVPAATVTFNYSNRLKDSGLYAPVYDAGTLKVWDVLQIRAKMIENSLTPDVLVVHDRDLPGLLYDASGAGIYLSSELYKPRLAGEIGKIMDLHIVSSLHMIEGAGILIDSSRLGWSVIKRPLEGRAEDKPEFDEVWYVLWAEREFGVTNERAIGLVTNAKTGDYSAADL